MRYVDLTWVTEAGAPAPCELQLLAKDGVFLQQVGATLRCAVLFHALGCSMRWWGRMRGRVRVLMGRLVVVWHCRQACRIPYGARCCKGSQRVIRTFTIGSITHARRSHVKCPTCFYRQAAGPTCSCAAAARPVRS